MVEKADLKQRDKRYSFKDTEFLISEIFYSIQGEGKYVGYPSLFIRLAKCNRDCSFCDTEFDIVNKVMSITEMAEFLYNYKGVNIIWTGGEPTLQWESIYKLRILTNRVSEWHLETNGDFINEEGVVSYDRVFSVMDYVCFSPKGLTVAKRLYGDLVNAIRLLDNIDIKVSDILLICLFFYDFFNLM